MFMKGDFPVTGNGCRCAGCRGCVLGRAGGVSARFRARSRAPGVGRLVVERSEQAHLLCDPLCAPMFRGRFSGQSGSACKRSTAICSVAKLWPCFNGTTSPCTHGALQAAQVATALAAPQAHLLVPRAGHDRVRGAKGSPVMIAPLPALRRAAALAGSRWSAQLHIDPAAAAARPSLVELVAR